MIDSPDFAHGDRRRAAVLLVNLGTPDAATPGAVRRYLAEFLGDPRVVEIPPAVWRPLLYGVILPVRAGRSAAKYASVWMPEGSPLKVWTERQTTLLRGALGERGLDVEVAYAMRYGNPSIPSVLDALRERGVDRLLVLPLYPQYSAATTATAFDAVFAHYARVRDVPEVRLVKHYHDDPAYIDACVDRLRHHWERHGQADVLVLSFHGMPKRTLLRGDPYHCECQKTGRLIAERAGVPAERVRITFQSRFGKAEWLQPYTEPTLVALAKRGVARADVFCPGFPADCLETLEEIAIEAKQAFLRAGGQTFHFIEGLNDRPAWIAALAGLCERHGAGWLDRRDTRAARTAEAEASRTRAQRAGAANLAG